MRDNSGLTMTVVGDKEKRSELRFSRRSNGQGLLIDLMWERRNFLRFPDWTPG